MEQSKKLTRWLTVLVALLIISCLFMGVFSWLWLHKALDSDQLLSLISWIFLNGCVIAASTSLIVKLTYKPLATLSDAILFAGHNSQTNFAPDTEKLVIGRELVTALAMQVYDLANMSAQGETLKTTEAPTTQSTMSAVTPAILDHVGLPLFGIDANQNITAINKAACDFSGVQASEAMGKPLYDVLKLSFDTEDTFEVWLKDRQVNAINSLHLWERVRTVDPNGSPIKQFDLVASFNKANSTGVETMLAIYDRTEQYSRDDAEISFVALAVHELRTPLTIMKGYVEVFEDEVGPTLSPELIGFMHKMHASAEQLTSFVGNILNVARIEENQLVLKLQSHTWAEVLKNAIDDLALRAGVHGKHIEVHIAENIPPVAVDRISIQEVINNLVDNAIKYSAKSDKIVISTGINQDGLIETSVQDFGIGIPPAVMPDLFQKFYRSHKSRVQIGGTGLGLYLCKAIVSAHGGNIWVRSKEGEGSIFSFTIEPFDLVKHEQTNGEDGIMRGAHGWIKNHTLNRQ